MNRELTKSEVDFLRVGVAVTVLDKLGFSSPKDSPIVKELNSTYPSSSTAFYDSVCTGIELIIQLNAFLSQLEMNDTWNFVHIVLTDGEDTSSKTSLESAMKLMLAVGLTLKTSTIKTYFIGIDVEQNFKATRDIAALTLAGGENAQFFQASTVKVEDIFEKIRVGLGIIQQTNMGIIANENAALIGVQQKYTPVLTLKKQKYVVLFNLDASGSMSGSRWKRVCESVRKFTNSLGEGDLVGGIIFNDKVKIITAPEEKPAKQTSTTSNHHQQTYTSSKYYKQTTTNTQSFPKNQRVEPQNDKCPKCNIF